MKPKYRVIIVTPNQIGRGKLRDTSDEAFDDGLTWIKGNRGLAKRAKVLIRRVEVVDGKTYEPEITRLRVDNILEALDNGEEVTREP